MTNSPVTPNDDPTAVMVDALNHTAGRVTLLIRYGKEKRAKIDLPSTGHGRGKDAKLESHRRELTELMDALYQWALSSGDISRASAEARHPERDFTQARKPR